MINVGFCFDSCSVLFYSSSSSLCCTFRSLATVVKSTTQLVNSQIHVFLVTSQQLPSSDMSDARWAGKVSDSQYSSGNPEMKSLVAILDLVDHVDYLDFDIQV